MVPEAAGTTLPPPRLQVRARVQVQARPMALRPTRPVVVAVLLAVPAGLVDAMGLRLGGVAAAVGAVGRAPRALRRHRSRPPGLVAHRPATVVAAAMAQAATTARKAGGRLVAIVRISNRGVVGPRRNRVFAASVDLLRVAPYIPFLRGTCASANTCTIACPR